MNKKIAFKSDGTKETGKKIIKALEELGGVNNFCLTGQTLCCYYINNQNCIDHVFSGELRGYELKDIHTYTKETELTFPRKMLVWDNDESKVVEDTVHGIFPDRASEWKVIGNRGTYKFAKEIPKSTTETSEKEKKADELIRLANEMLELAKELKK